MTDLSVDPQVLASYRPTNKVRFVTAASLFDGHDAAINIMRRILQSMGAEVIHLGHNRSVDVDMGGGVSRAARRRAAVWRHKADEAVDSAAVDAVVPVASCASPLTLNDEWADAVGRSSSALPASSAALAVKPSRQLRDVVRVRARLR